MVDEAALRTAADTVVTALAGPGARVRDDQLAAVRALVVERRRALVVQATGWGKSAVYWIAARALRDAGAGPVLVVSPLLSLMRDQVEAASRAGLAAVTLHSANMDEWSVLEARMAADDVDVVLVSPERLASPRFAGDVLTWLVPRLGLLVIDESHCISSWGSDFRPDYQRVARLLMERPDLPVLATTATANARVTSDVAAQLGADTFVQRGTLGRSSLHYAVVDGLSPVQRYAWVDEALGVLPGSGIVYALTVAEAERLSAFLTSRGHEVAAYHGQLDAPVRAELEDRLRANELKAVVATSALGMGFDKPDVAFVVHVGAPASPIDYYQQVGRAGRAVEQAAVVLLPSASDEPLWEWFATASVPDRAQAGAVLAHLQAAPAPVSVVAVETATGVRRSRVDLLLKTLAVDGAVRRDVDGWVATGAAWTYDADRYAALVQARRGEAALMRAYARGEMCLESVLRRALDDAVAEDARCGRCSVCTGSLPAGLSGAPASASSEAALAFLRGIDVVLEPRKMWPSGMAAVRGRIGADVAVLPGRAVGFGDDPAWPVNAVCAPGLADQPVPDWVVDAVVDVLRRWRPSWDARPVAVAFVPSVTRPVFVRSLAERVAAVGRLPLLDVLVSSGPPPGDGAPAARARALESRLQARPGVAVPDGPVLVLDDTYRTGWTMTLAGALLRQAGASAVLPLVVQQRP